MKYLTSISCLISVLALGAMPLRACTCAPPGQRNAYRDANTIFVGEVVEVNEKTQIPPKLKNMVFASVRFKVEKAWKGAPGRDITILSDLGLLSCHQTTNKFRPGRRYLVYAYDRELTDYGCSRSVLIEDAGKDIKRLNNLWFRMFARMYPFPKR